MRCLIGFLLAIFMFTNFCSAEDFIGIEEYIDKDGLKNRYDEGFIHLRCSGLIMALIKFKPSEERFMLYAEDQFTKAGVAYLDWGQTKPNEVMKQIGSSLVSIVDHYYNEIKEKQENEGDIFTGQLAREFKFCLEF